MFKEKERKKERKEEGNLAGTLFKCSTNLHKSLENNVGSDGINYKIRDTDAFLWMIRDLLDNFMSYNSVKDVVFNKDVIIAIDKMFVEIKLEYHFIQLLFANAPKNGKQ